MDTDLVVVLHERLAAAGFRQDHGYEINVRYIPEGVVVEVVQHGTTLIYEIAATLDEALLQATFEVEWAARAAGLS